MKTIVPIALSSRETEPPKRSRWSRALAGAANATAAVSVAEVAFRVVAATLRKVASTVASGWTLVSVAAVASADSVVFGASDSGFAVGFAVGCCLTARRLAGFATTFSAVSESALTASLTVSAGGCSAGCSSAAVASSPCLAASVRWAPLKSALFFFGFLPTGFGFGAAAPAVPESALVSAGFADSDEVVPLASEPGGLSAIATPAPATMAAATPAVTIPAPIHTKNRSTMPVSRPRPRKR